MYAQGLGVPRDLVTACSLAQLTFMLTRAAAPRAVEDVAPHDARVKEADGFSSKHSDGLSEL